MEKKSNYLKSPDLLPIGYGDRNIGTFGFAVIWVGMAIVLAAFAIGGGGIQHLPLGMVLLATIIGSLAIGIFMSIIGDIGIEHGLSFPVYMRAPFGTFGTHIPSIVRGVTAACWFGINTYFGASAINGILFLLFGFDQWFVCFLLFAAAQLINTALGIKSIERFADLAAPIIILISCWMYITLSGSATAQGKEIWAWVESPVTGMTAFTAFMVVVMANMGFWATLAADMPSLSRFFKAPKNERNWFKRNKSQLVGNMIVMPVVNTFMIAIGAVSYMAVSTADPIIALQEAASGIVLGVLLLMIVLAQWSTNTSANVIPAATIFSNIGGPKVPFWVGVIIAGVIGMLAQPWSLFDVLNQALLVIGGILTSIVGILFADYYLLRKRRVNVKALYEGDGQYKYLSGFNLAGLVAWITGGVAANLLPAYSSLVGFAVGAAVYYVLAKYWWFEKYKQAEIEDPSDEKYLGLTVGRDWEITEEEELIVLPEAANERV
ncbi:NCS1 family transporter [Cytobacillus purgationiresistens]|uniref:NCS1 family nucleobase:cation symporter-1 n=1 Tax=Cytobacillus purgationiresistens TaxID=863449 RepID=A0ABU0AAI6_9BACI|nr:NCS1 family transporter [Cytobacillus purgationiresistens]MDQ0268261.1 NCS1 family nucleobase:cation symporter-1 [Cytobacillus purgationiresistens]